tara:strand:- start:1443 stop:2162 length:720 start_codon:yes stop_codon:yes gene_type:complete
MKSCIIKQPAGVGDVFFLQKIARTYLDKGHSIIWPLRDDIFWISEYIPDIQWCKLSEWMKDPRSKLFNYAGFGEVEGFIYIDTSTADRTFNTDPNMIMRSKFGLVGIDHKDWGKYFKFNRKNDREDELYYNILGLNDDSEYVYVNDLTNTDIRKTSSLGEKEYDYPVIENRIIDGFSLFDWTKVLENAKEIHTVPTALCYIVDVIDTKAKTFYYPNDRRHYNDHIDLFTNVTKYVGYEL